MIGGLSETKKNKNRAIIVLTRPYLTTQYKRISKCITQKLISWALRGILNCIGRSREVLRGRVSSCTISEPHNCVSRRRLGPNGSRRRVLNSLRSLVSIDRPTRLSLLFSFWNARGIKEKHIIFVLSCDSQLCNAVN